MINLLQPARYDDNNRANKFKVYKMQARKAVANVIHKYNLAAEIRTEYDQTGLKRSVIHSVVDILLKIVDSAYPKPNLIDLPVAFMIGAIAIEEVVKLLNASGREVGQQDISNLAPLVMIAFMNMIKGRYDVEKYRFYMQDLQQASQDGRIQNLMDLGRGQ